MPNAGGRYRCARFDVHDQHLIEQARITGQPVHVALAIEIALQGFNDRLRQKLQCGLPWHLHTIMRRNPEKLVRGELVIPFSMTAKGCFFDQYIIALALQELSNEIGIGVAAAYTGQRITTNESSSPDIEFLP